MAELDIRFIDNQGTSRSASNFFSGVIKELPQELSDFHVAENKAFLKLAQAKEGFTKEPITLVDGKTNKPLRDVKPFGTITYLDPSTNLGEFFLSAYDAILRVSPVDEGKYINLNWIYYNNNNTPVAKSRFEFNRWLENKELNPGDTISFVNAAPYARRLEFLGIKAGRASTVGEGGRLKFRKKQGFRVGVPNGAYISAQRSISRIFKGFGTVPSVQFRPKTIVLPQFSSNFFKKEGRGFGRPYLYPHIDVRIQSGSGGFGNVQ